MRDVVLHDPPYAPDEHAPTEDDLPYDEELPLESERHVLQMYLLRETLTLAWADRPDVYVGIDMFVYFSPTQVLTEDFRGPDVFVTMGVPKRERKSWLVWQEGKPPDVVIELLSESTARFDMVEKKRIYQDRLRVPEYFWYDPFSAELAGFVLVGGLYQPIAADGAGRLPSAALGLTLVRWQGAFQEVEATWLRWATPEGTLLPTEAEVRTAVARERDTAVRERDAALRRIAELEALLADQRPDQNGERG